eukprot:PhM_4_TR11596/c0_g1_i1/m.58172/K01239/iunH; purine nucleosidase
MSKRPVILDHDGGVDDLVALVILLADLKNDIDFKGVVCIDADCFVDDGCEVSAQVLAMFDLHRTVPVGRSSLLGVHEFPKEWRKDAINMKCLPCVNTELVTKRLEEHNPLRKDITGEALMAELVLASPDPVTLVVTGPLSNVAWCIQKHGEAFTSKVKEVIIMGGAVDVAGNVFPPFVAADAADGSQEWNIYWDAPAARTVLECPHPLRNILFSLDSTNHVPVNEPFVRRFGRQNDMSLVSQFVGASWAMCTHFAAVFGEQHGYFAWDALTAAYVVDAGVCDLEEVNVHVITEGLAEGRTKRVSKSEVPATSKAANFMATNTRAEFFMDLVLKCSQRGAAPGSKP